MALKAGPVNFFFFFFFKLANAAEECRATLAAEELKLGGKLITPVHEEPNTDAFN